MLQFHWSEVESRGAVLVWLQMRSVKRARLEDDSSCVSLLRVALSDESIDDTFCYVDNLRDELGEHLLHRMLVENSPPLHEIQEIVWEKLHSGPWNQTHVLWRELHAWIAVRTATQIIQNLITASATREDIEQDDISSLKCMFQTLDTALIIGGQHYTDIIHVLIRGVELALEHSLPWRIYKQKKKNIIQQLEREASESQPLIPVTLHANRLALPEFNISELPLIKFVDFMKKAETPVLINGLIDSWPAFSGDNNWTNLANLSELSGHRFVPIEVGNHYVDEQWSQKMMFLDEFLEQFMLKKDPSSGIGYLAQHTLFGQIQKLKEGIIVPDYCSMSVDLESTNDSDVEDSLPFVKINAWIGPSDTVSPLHYDPEHNLLCQVKGCKYIRLYKPSESSKLYPHEAGSLLSNTSQVDVENPDHDQFPEFEKAVFWECFLKEGQSLYIPPKFWHFVRSLSLSCSVSFWWH